MTKLALTFDAEHPDYPHGPPEQCGQILDALAAAGARATFFVQGRWARAQPALARRIADDGHLVGLHCHSHVPYLWFTDTGVGADLSTGRQAVLDACGVDPAPWFRFPYGRGADDPRLVGLVRDAGFENIHWNVDPRDWDPCMGADDVVEAVLAAAGGGGVVLLHIWPAATAAALPTLLARLPAHGVDLVTVAGIDPADRAGLALAPTRPTLAECDVH